jgi:hypothetical protein
MHLARMTRPTGRLRAVPTNWICIALLVATAVCSRLPQLLSPYLLLDGDECVLGLMAKHLLEGREFPVFFYGQEYGLSTVEAAVGALAFVIAAPDAVPLKLAMLALWTAGCALYFLAFTRPYGVKRSFLITLLIVLAPSWAVWSMKARGGYLTAFFATGALFYLLFRTDDGRHGRPLRWMVAGVLTALIYFAQPMWLVGALPVLTYRLVSSRKFLVIIAYCAGLAAVMILIPLLARSPERLAWGRPELGNQALLGTLPNLAVKTYVNLTGSYYLGTALEPGPVTSASAYVWIAVLIVLTLVQLGRIILRKYYLWSHLFCLATWSTLCVHWAILGSGHARYLLPLSATMAFWVGAELTESARRSRFAERLTIAFVIGLLGIGAVSMTEFRHFVFIPPTFAERVTEAQRLDTLIHYLHTKGVRHVFSMNELLQWQISFYSRETVIARSTGQIDRYPPYIREINNALKAGATIAIVGYADWPRGPDRELSRTGGIVTIGDRYVAYVGPSEELLRRLGFRLRN